LNWLLDFCFLFSILNLFLFHFLFYLKGAPERWRLIKAHGTAVGLPTDDDMGNSEVGHNALGAGRIYAQGYFTS